MRCLTKKTFQLAFDGMLPAQAGLKCKDFFHFIIRKAENPTVSKKKNKYIKNKQYNLCCASADKYPAI